MPRQLYRVASGLGCGIDGAAAQPFLVDTSIDEA
jgi:hypothetical protein